MKTLTHILTVILTLLPIFSSLSQGPPYTNPFTSPDTTDRIRIISMAPDTNQFEVTPLKPSKKGAFFSHLWWSGDNCFSFADKPSHNHKNTLGNPSFPDVKMTDITTESYGNGGPPPLTYHFTIEDTSGTFANSKVVLDSGTYIYVQNYRNAVIDDIMYMIVTYGNSYPYVLNGKLKFDVGDHAVIDHDILTDNPHYLSNGETWNSGTEEFEFVGLGIGEERSILIPVKILDNEEEALELRVDFYRFNIPENAAMGRDFYTISPTVAHSHDPNQMIEHSTAKNQCDYRGGKIHYTVKFQNEGEGRTRYIRVECHLDDKVDLESITGIKVPACFDSCAAGPIYGRYNSNTKNCSFWSVDHSTRILTFEMHNIYLYNVNDPNLPSIDMARDQIEFDILVKDDYLFGPPVLAYSKIYFDKNDAIVTNICETGCSSPVPLDQGGGFQGSDDSFICKYKCYILGGLLGLILLLLILLARKKKRRNATSK